MPTDMSSMNMSDIRYDFSRRLILTISLIFKHAMIFCFTVLQ